MSNFSCFKNLNCLKNIDSDWVYEQNDTDKQNKVLELIESVRRWTLQSENKQELIYRPSARPHKPAHGASGATERQLNHNNNVLKRNASMPDTRGTSHHEAHQPRWFEAEASGTDLDSDGSPGPLFSSSSSKGLHGSCSRSSSSSGSRDTVDYVVEKAKSSRHHHHTLPRNSKLGSRQLSEPSFPTRYRLKCTMKDSVSQTKSNPSQPTKNNRGLTQSPSENSPPKLSFVVSADDYRKRKVDKYDKWDSEFTRRYINRESTVDVKYRDSPISTSQNPLPAKYGEGTYSSEGKPKSSRFTDRRNQFLNQSFSSMRDLQKEDKTRQLNERYLYPSASLIHKTASMSLRGGSARVHLVPGGTKDVLTKEKETSTEELITTGFNQLGSVTYRQKFEESVSPADLNVRPLAKHEECFMSPNLIRSLSVAIGLLVPILLVSRKLRKKSRVANDDDASDSTPDPLPCEQRNCQGKVIAPNESSRNVLLTNSRLSKEIRGPLLQKSKSGRNVSEWPRSSAGMTRPLSGPALTKLFGSNPPVKASTPNEILPPQDGPAFKFPIGNAKPALGSVAAKRLGSYVSGRIAELEKVQGGRVEDSFHSVLTQSEATSQSEFESSTLYKTAFEDQPPTLPIAKARVQAPPLIQKRSRSRIAPAQTALGHEGDETMEWESSKERQGLRQPNFQSRLTLTSVASPAAWATDQFQTAISSTPLAGDGGQEVNPNGSYTEPRANGTDEEEENTAYNTADEEALDGTEANWITVESNESTLRNETELEFAQSEGAESAWSTGQDVDTKALQDPTKGDEWSTVQDTITSEDWSTIQEPITSEVPDASEAWGTIQEGVDDAHAESTESDSEPVQNEIAWASVVEEEEQDSPSEASTPQKADPGASVWGNGPDSPSEPWQTVIEADSIQDPSPMLEEHLEDGEPYSNTWDQPGDNFHTMTEVSDVNPWGVANLPPPSHETQPPATTPKGSRLKRVAHFKGQSGLCDTEDLYCDDELNGDDPNMQLEITKAGVISPGGDGLEVEAAPPKYSNQPMLVDQESILSMDFPSTGPTSLRSNCTDDTADEAIKEEDELEEEEEEDPVLTSKEERFTALISPEELSSSKLIYSKTEASMD